MSLTKERRRCTAAASVRTWRYTGASFTSSWQAGQYLRLTICTARMCLCLLFFFSCLAKSGLNSLTCWGVSAEFHKQLQFVRHQTDIKQSSPASLCVSGSHILAHLLRSDSYTWNCVLVVTCWLIGLLFVLLWYFSLVVMSRPRGELQLQSGNMDFFFLLWWRRKSSGGAWGSRLLSEL